MNPLNEYTLRREKWSAANQSLEKRFNDIGNWRLATALTFALLAWLAWGPGSISSWWLLVPVGVFIALAVWHGRITRERTFARRAVTYYDHGLARLADHWMGTGNTGERFSNPEHVYSGDLDIFGKGSIFELVCTARTGAGESMLAQWFQAPGSLTEIHDRQEAVRELRPKLDLREDLALLGEDVRAGVHAEGLGAWGSSPPVRFAPYLRPLSLLLAIAGVVLILAFFAHLVPLWPFVAVLGCDFLLIAVLRKRVTHVIAAIDTPGHELAILSLVLERLERESFESPYLKRLRTSMDVGRWPASKRIAQLQRWVATIDSSDHLLIRAIRPVLLWQEQLAMGVEAWRAQAGAHVGPWLRAVGEFEALSSLASLSFEHPAWNFPILENTSYPVFEGASLCHPLLSSAKCVPNDVSLGSHAGHCDLLIISGSNMSGKSTLLRSIGLNTVLAWAGAPVAAERLRVSALQIGASLRVVDSLQDGRSRFMAEITRLRQIVALTEGRPPVLFLLDELLSGTNSHDRRIGASAIVHGLLERGAIGLITTHDLALADLERDWESKAANMHFEDVIIDGRIEFDYRLRPGVVVRSNALELMRAVGLNV
jgi:hypothetical protein